MNKEILKYVIQQSLTAPLPEARPREIELPLDSNKVVSLVGVRRSGKTFLMFATIQRLLDQGVERERILYVNLSDDRLFPVTLEELDLVLVAHSELHPETLSGPRYLFLDEVQEVPGWERYVRRIYDTEEVHVFVTGSSSKLLTRDLAPAMRGRGISFEVFPLSFAEYVAFRDLPVRRYNRSDEARLVNALEEYVRWGGLPEIVLAEEAMRPLILEEYSSLLFFRDLVERYSVRNEHVMKLLLKYCSCHPASLLSVHKLHRDFRSQGVSVSKNTLYEYLGYLQDAFVLFTAPKHEQSLRKQTQNPSKLHLVDVALARAFGSHPDRDLGHKLENLVFLHERRQKRDLFYYSNAHEIDLVSASPEPLRFINVAWSLTDPVTLAREREAMAFGAARYPGAEGLLVAHETAGSGRLRSPLKAVPAWRFLLGR